MKGGQGCTQKSVLSILGTRRKERNSQAIYINNQQRRLNIEGEAGGAEGKVDDVKQVNTDPWSSECGKDEQKNDKILVGEM